MNIIPSTYLPHAADSAAGIEEMVLPLVTLADAVCEHAAAAVRAIALSEQADSAQALRERADSLVDSAPSFAADLYAAADRYGAALH